MCAVAPCESVAKAWSFPREVLRLGELLAGAASPRERELVALARRLLGVDWGNRRASERTRVLAEVLAAMRKVGVTVGPELEPRLARSARQTVRASRDRTREGGIPVAVDFGRVARGVVERLPGLHALYVRDEMGRRVDSFGATARSIVARGLAEGLGRGDIAADLAAAADGLRARSYWDLIAASFMGTARSLGELTAYAEAGVRRYELVATLDEHTTPFCVLINGTVFSVGDALQRWEAVARSQDPFALKASFPWVRSSRGDDGSVELWVRRGEDRESIAKVDAAGRSEAPPSAERLTELGLGLPPFHGHCRTTCLPIL